MRARVATLLLLGFLVACTQRSATPVTWHVECALTCDGSPSTASVDVCQPDNLSEKDILEGSEVTASIVFAIVGCSTHTSDCRATPGTTSCAATASPSPTK